MSRLASCIIVVAAVIGCHKNNNYCPGANPNNNCSEDAATDTPRACTTDMQCSQPTPVCDTSAMTCVLCTAAEPAACTGTTPVCGADDTCHACTMHSQCASDVCLPDGSCSDGSNVAYVAPTGSGTACTKAAPCMTVANALATLRPFVKMTGTTDEAVTVGRNVTFLADPGAVLTRTAGAGNIVTVSGTSVVSIYDLEVSGALGSGVGVSIPTGATPTVGLYRMKLRNNAGGGISSSGGTLTVSQSTVSGNAGGGISVTSAQFTIVSNFIATNGSVSTAYGGVLLSQTNSGTRVFEFNTVTANGGATGTVTGVSCVLLTQPNTFSNNIIYANQVGGGGTQVGGTNCSYTYSDIGPETPTPAGTGNINMDPLFANASTGDFHLTSGSPVRGKADPAADLTGIAAKDIDGDTRTAPADIGADEYP